MALRCVALLCGGRAIGGWLPERKVAPTHVSYPARQSSQTSLQPAWCLVGTSRGGARGSATSGFELNPDVPQPSSRGSDMPSWHLRPAAPLCYRVAVEGAEKGSNLLACLKPHSLSAISPSKPPGIVFAWRPGSFKRMSVWLLRYESDQPFQHREHSLLDRRLGAPGFSFLCKSSLLSPRRLMMLANSALRRQNVAHL